MRLNIFKQTGGRVPLKRLERMFEKLSIEEKKPGWRGTVNLIFINDKEIQALNRQFRRINKPTDVLAFNIDHPNDDESVFGEVYVSIPTATRQAKQAGSALAEELVRLSCHGLLHLFGYDHVKVRDAAQMQALEDYFVNYSRKASNG
jgi:probable rRNA maturation factor